MDFQRACLEASGWSRVDSWHPIDLKDHLEAVGPLTLRALL